MVKDKHKESTFQVVFKKGVVSCDDGDITYPVDTVVEFNMYIHNTGRSGYYVATDTSGRTSSCSGHFTFDENKRLVDFDGLHLLPKMAFDQLQLWGYDVSEEVHNILPTGSGWVLKLTL